MQTLTIDIINENAVRLIRDLEMLKLIRVRKEKKEEKDISLAARYKGAMQKQDLTDIDNQLNDLRSSWE